MLAREVTDPIGGLLGDAVATIAPSETLRRAARQLTREHLGLLVVVDGHGVRGVLSERDIITADADGLDLDDERVIDHATSEVVSLEDDASIALAAATMTDAEVRHLAVTRQGETVGVVSVRDVVAVLSRAVGTPAATGG